MNNGKKNEQVTRANFFRRVVMAVPKSLPVHHPVPTYLVIKKETVSKVSMKVMNQSIQHREQ